MEQVLESVKAFISVDHLLQQEPKEGQPLQQIEANNEAQLDGPVIRRWDGDDALAKEIVSCRFLLLPEGMDESTIGELQAKRIVGSSWIASSFWTAVESPPEPYVFSSSRP